MSISQYAMFCKAGGRFFIIKVCHILFGVPPGVGVHLGGRPFCGVHRDAVPVPTLWA